LRLVSDFHLDNEDNTGKGSGEGKFSQPLDIATDSSGSVNPVGIAIDSSGTCMSAILVKNNRIQNFDSNGNYITKNLSEKSSYSMSNPGTSKM
jgi:hypothetical protein